MDQFLLRPHHYNNWVKDHTSTLVEVHLTCFVKDLVHFCTRISTNALSFIFNNWSKQSFWTNDIHYRPLMNVSSITSAFLLQLCYSNLSALISSCNGCGILSCSKNWIEQEIYHLSLVDQIILNVLRNKWTTILVQILLFTIQNQYNYYWKHFHNKWMSSK